MEPKDGGGHFYFVISGSEDKDGDDFSFSGFQTLFLNWMNELAVNLSFSAEQFCTSGITEIKYVGTAYKTIVLVFGTTSWWHWYENLCEYVNKIGSTAGELLVAM